MFGAIRNCQRGTSPVTASSKVAGTHRMSKGTMISCGHLRVFLTVLALASGVSGVIAAEDPLFGRLADLTVSKGDKDAQVGKICLALGLTVKKDGSCLVYQTLTKESGRLHSINVLNRAGKTTRSVFLFLHDDLVGKVWLIDEAGRLQKAASGFYNNEWTWTEVPINKGTKDRFAKEVDYWRAKEEELAHEPDRKN